MTIWMTVNTGNKKTDNLMGIFGRKDLGTVMNYIEEPKKESALPSTKI